MVEQHELSARSAHPAHLTKHSYGIGNRGQYVWGVYGRERAVAEPQSRCVHLQQTNIAQLLPLHTVGGLVEHPAREIDAGDVAVLRIERGGQPGSNPDLEHGIAW